MATILRGLNGVFKRPAQTVAPAHFAGLEPRPDYERRLARRAPADRTCVIFFTARSGSTWLTQTLRATGRLGDPAEWFSPKHMRQRAEKLGVHCLDSYVEILRRRKAPGGIFSFEIVHNQLMGTFGSEAAFAAMFPPTLPCFYLTRRDIVAQAISLAKMKAVAVSHSTQVSKADIARAEVNFAYDRRLIARNVSNLLTQERRSERMFESLGYRPHRLVYEDMMAAGPEAAIARFCEALKVDAPCPAPRTEATMRVGTRQNLDYAARFRAESEAFLSRVASERYCGTTL